MALITYLTNTPLVLALMAGLVAGMPHQVRENVNILPIDPTEGVKAIVTTIWTALPLSDRAEQTTKAEEHSSVTTQVTPPTITTSTAPATTDLEIVTTLDTSSTHTSTADPTTYYSGKPAKWDDKFFHLWPGQSDTATTTWITSTKYPISTVDATVSDTATNTRITSTKYPISTVDASVACRPTMC